MAEMSTFSVKAGVLSSVEAVVWPSIKEKIRPLVWSWYNDHRDEKIKRVFGFSVTVSSFGVVAFVLERIFGSETV